MNANNESFLNLPTLFVDMLNFVVLLVLRATRIPEDLTPIPYVRLVLKNTPESPRSNNEQTPKCAIWQYEMCVICALLLVVHHCEGSVNSRDCE